MQWNLKMRNPVDLVAGFRNEIDGEPRCALPQNTPPPFCAWQHIREVEDLAVEQQWGGASVLCLQV